MIIQTFRPNTTLRSAILVFFTVSFSLTLLPALTRETETERAQITVHTGHEGCTVEIDALVAGKTDAQGTMVLKEVEPADHYIHVRCPDQDELVFFVSPRTGKNLEIHPGSAEAVVVSSAASPLEAARNKTQLRQLIQDAIQLRAKGHLELAVQHLRDAAKLDPDNSDLHRELGITFLLVKEWKRARVEMLEAIRQEPNDADAHNGLGYALEKLRQLDAALKEYRIATRLDPDDASYRQHYVDAMSRLAGEQAEKKK